jgi:hypothetical protein
VKYEVLKVVSLKFQSSLGFFAVLTLVLLDPEDEGITIFYKASN